MFLAKNLVTLVDTTTTWNADEHHEFLVNFVFQLCVSLWIDLFYYFCYVAASLLSFLDDFSRLAVSSFFVSHPGSLFVKHAKPTSLAWSEVRWNAPPPFPFQFFKSFFALRASFYLDFCFVFNFTYHIDVHLHQIVFFQVRLKNRVLHRRKDKSNVLRIWKSNIYRYYWHVLFFAFNFDTIKRTRETI